MFDSCGREEQTGHRTTVFDSASIWGPLKFVLELEFILSNNGFRAVSPVFDLDI